MNGARNAEGPQVSAQPPVGERRLFKPAPPHNSLKAPVACGCVECCRIVLDLRCPAVSPEGHPCGDYKGHRGHHSMIPASVFVMAEERLLLDVPDYGDKRTGEA